MLTFYQTTPHSQQVQDTFHSMIDTDDLSDFYLHQARQAEEERHRKISQAIALQEYRNYQKQKERQAEQFRKRRMEIIAQRQRQLQYEKELKERQEAEALLEERVLAQMINQARNEYEREVEQRHLNLQRRQQQQQLRLKQQQQLELEQRQQQQQQQQERSVPMFYFRTSSPSATCVPVCCQSAEPCNVSEKPKQAVKPTEPSQEQQSVNPDYEALVNRVKLAFQMAADARAPKSEQPVQPAATQAGPSTSASAFSKPAATQPVPSTSASAPGPITERPESRNSAGEEQAPATNNDRTENQAEEETTFNPEHKSMHDRSKSLTDLESIRAQFRRASDSFVQPPSLDVSENGEIAFNSTNMPVHKQENTLINLMQKVDAVESHGDELIRAARKNLIADIDRELQRIDEVKSEAVASSSSRESSIAGDDHSDQDDSEIVGKEEAKDQDSPASVLPVETAEANFGDSVNSEPKSDQQSQQEVLEANTSDEPVKQAAEQRQADDDFELL